MPTYVYCCSRCEKTSEQFKPISKADELIKCPVCGAYMSKVPCGGLFKLSGGGWADSGYSK